MTNILKSIAPILIIGIVAFIGYWVKLIIDKNKNVKKSEGHIWVQIVPKAGNEHNFMVPIQADNGVGHIRVPNLQGRVDSSSPMHILGEDGEFSAIWPPGKAKFTQIPVQKIVYYEGDSEPLSNISDRPVVSGQLIANVVDGVATATVDAFRRSQEDSAGVGIKKTNPLLWVYILLISGVATGIVNIVLNAMGLSAADAINKLTVLVQQALGLR